MVQELLVSTQVTEVESCQKQTMEKSPVFDILISSQLRGCVGLTEEKDSRLPSLLSELKMTRKKMSVCPFASVLLKHNSSIADDRDCAVSSLRCMTLFYGSDTQTFATAVSFLDRFLSKVKVQHRYLSCVAAACYFLAAKINEEPENQPTASELSQLHRQTWKSSDLMRMEFLILEKLNWQLWPINCPVFLRIFCDIVKSIMPKTKSSLLEVAFYLYSVCINYSSSVVYKPSTLALCILQKAFQELELLSFATHQLISWLHQMCEVKDSEIFECHSNITFILSNFTNRPESHPSCLPIPKPQPRRSIISRPSYYGDSDLPTIEEEESVIVSIEMDKNTEDVNEEHILYKDNRKSWSYCILPDRCLLPSETVFTFK